MDETLKKNPKGVLVGDKVTIADISAWGWVASASESAPTFSFLSILVFVNAC